MAVNHWARKLSWWQVAEVTERNNHAAHRCEVGPHCECWQIAEQAKARLKTGVS